ncbi:hypothetical protein ACNO8X_05885 [Mycobacterium sp. PDNC021]|uniref:hypothetical protein n=1 Tax=Mycobacterium sp. PDNC021 TaxID=3391399 RepID=UPI003AAF20E9
MLPPNLQPRDRIMVRDIDGMRAVQHNDADGQIAVGIWLLLPGLLIVGAVGVATLIIRARKSWSHPGESNP